jgi:hypothetical protein
MAAMRVGEHVYCSYSFRNSAVAGSLLQSAICRILNTLQELLLHGIKIFTIMRIVYLAGIPVSLSNDV